MKQILPREQEVRTLCEIVRTHLGLKFGDEKVPLITSRLGKRLRELGVENYKQYLDIVTECSEEFALMLDLLTTNVTHFFREPWQFHFLINSVIPDLKEEKRDKTVRCWSAGCATGEEPYTLGMILREHLPADWMIKILASDISAASLQVGSEGSYRIDQTKEVPKSFLQKYFKPPNKGTLQVAYELRQTVFFKRINLLDDRALPERIMMDFIFCRNVFIYFPKEVQRKVLELFYRHLTPGGYLFLGHSESLDIIEDNRWKGFKGSIYRKL